MPFVPPITSVQHSVLSREQPVGSGKYSIIADVKTITPSRDYVYGGDKIKFDLLVTDAERNGARVLLADYNSGQTQKFKVINGNFDFEFAGLVSEISVINRWDVSVTMMVVGQPAPVVHPTVQMEISAEEAMQLVQNGMLSTDEARKQLELYPIPDMAPSYFGAQLRWLAEGELTQDGDVLFDTGGHPKDVVRLSGLTAYRHGFARQIALPGEPSYVDLRAARQAAGITLPTSSGTFMGYVGDTGPTSFTHVPAMPIWSEPESKEMFVPAKRASITKPKPKPMEIYTPPLPGQRRFRRD